MPSTSRNSSRIRSASSVVSDDITVVVKFLPPAARHVLESTWHASQALNAIADGSVLAQFQLSTTIEIKSWVLSFGANAHALEPAALRAEIAAELQQMAKLYALPLCHRRDNPSADGQAGLEPPGEADHRRQTQEPLR